MTFILDGLYLGDYEDACNRCKLETNGITHILTIDMKPLPIEQRKGFTCKYVHALDMDDFDLLIHLTECVQFIDEGRKSGGGVLVHCLAGESRSATVVAAYLMHGMEMTVEDSLALLHCQRPQIRPNAGFLSQLELYEEMGNVVNTESQSYKQYKMQNLALQIHTAQSEALLQNIAADPSHGLNPAEIFYKCRKCRRPLFKKTSVMTHTVGRGQAAFKPWQKKLTDDNCFEEEVSVCDGKSLFIEPVQWMGESVLEIEGKLSCPKCSAKLGSFKWTGENCPCGTWVTPAFHVQTNKVDLTKQPIIHTVHRPLPRAGLQLSGPTHEQQAPTQTTESIDKNKSITGTKNSEGLDENKSITETKKFEGLSLDENKSITEAEIK